MKAIFLFLLVCLSHFGHTQKTSNRVSQNPKADSLYLLAIELGYREQFKIAISYLDSAIQSDSNIEHVFFDRGVLKEHIGDTTGAIQDFTTQIQLDKRDADAYFLRGMLYFGSKNFTKAYQDLNKANHLDPGNADAHCYCADAAKALNKNRQFQRKSERCRLLKGLLE
jgi:tetratricopeptide (TPR) repeat protein